MSLCAFEFQVHVTYLEDLWGRGGSFLWVLVQRCKKKRSRCKADSNRQRNCKSISHGKSKNNFKNAFQHQNGIRVCPFLLVFYKTLQR